MIVVPRGLLDQTPGLYPPDVLAQWRRRLPDLDVIMVDDHNHYSVIMTPDGAQAVAARLSGEY